MLFIIKSLSLFSSKSHDGDKFIPAPPSSPLRKQELENLKWVSKQNDLQCICWNKHIVFNLSSVNIINYINVKCEANFSILWQTPLVRMYFLQINWIRFVNILLGIFASKFTRKVGPHFLYVFGKVLVSRLCWTYKWVGKCFFLLFSERVCIR